MKHFNLIFIVQSNHLIEFSDSLPYFGFTSVPEYWHDGAEHIKKQCGSDQETAILSSLARYDEEGTCEWKKFSAYEKGSFRTPTFHVNCGA